MRMISQDNFKAFTWVLTSWLTKWLICHYVITSEKMYSLMNWQSNFEKNYVSFCSQHRALAVSGKILITKIDTKDTSKFYFRQNTTMIQEQKTLCKYRNAHNIETLLHSAGGHHGRHKAYQAGNQNRYQDICRDNYAEGSACAVMTSFGCQIHKC